MHDHLTWTDDTGVTHALVDDERAEREPPYPLVAMCNAGMHTHEHSDQIREEHRSRALTCLRCIEALFVGREPTWWPNNEDAPCCALIARAT